MTEDTREDAVEQREGLMVAERKARKEVERKASRLETLEIEYVSVDEVKPNAYNPNRQSEHDFELLLRSIEEDGFTQPIVVIKVTEETREDPAFKHFDLGDTVIVDGEHRWRACKRLGYEEIPVAYTPMTPEQMRVATLRHNRARGSEDIELAAQVLRDLRDMGALDAAADSLLYDDVELQRLLEDVPAPEALADEEPSRPWVPDSAVGGDGQALSVEGETRQTQDGSWVNGATRGAVDAVREREQKIASAKTEEQREMIRRDDAKQFFRLSLIFHGDEADLVKKVVGGAPAEAILDICREKEGVLREELKDGSWVTLDSVLGARAIPAEAAAVLKQAIERMEADGTIHSRNRFQVIEYLAAEYLGGT